MRHFFDRESGETSYNSEFSTIDTALLLISALKIAKNMQSSK